MKTITSVALAALMLAGCNPGEAQTGAAEGPTAAGAVTLVEKPALSADVDAMPRLAGDSPAIARINAALDANDAGAKADAEACAADAGDGPGGGFSRFITRPMTGPAYVTLREHSEWYCGGAYPSTSQTAVTYDVQTGARIDWAAAVPGLGLAFYSYEGEEPGEDKLLMRSAALGAWYSRKMLANPEAEWVEQCRDVLDPAALAEQTFNIWADAENGGVTIAPDFAHVVQACADSATLTAADLRQFNADPKLVDAITAAHAAGNWAPKDDAEPAE
jgi:hypothetical protein